MSTGWDMLIKIGIELILFIAGLMIGLFIWAVSMDSLESEDD